MSARYLGLDARTGKSCTGLDHIRQSIQKILTTPIGHRLERRDFGSWVPELIDQPANGKTLLQTMAASVMAIRTWEPRVDLSRIQISHGGDGASLYVDLDLTRRDGPAAGQSARLSVQLRS